MRIDYYSALVQVDVASRRIIRIVCVFEDSAKAYEELKKLSVPFRLYDGTSYEVQSVEIEFEK